MGEQDLTDFIGIVEVSQGFLERAFQDIIQHLKQVFRHRPGWPGTDWLTAPDPGNQFRGKMEGSVNTTFPFGMITGKNRLVGKMVGTRIQLNFVAIPGYN